MTANTSVSGWFLRLVAIAFGLACLAVLTVGTVGGALILLALLAIVHAIRHRTGKPLTLMQSWATAVVVAALLTAGVLAWAMTLHDKTGKTYWHSMLATAEQADQHPPPPPRFLRYLPGGNIQPAPLPKAANAPFLILSLAVGAEFIGAIFGSLIWGGAWMIVSGWKGRLAGYITKPSSLGWEP